MVSKPCAEYKSKVQSSKSKVCEFATYRLRGRREPWKWLVNRESRIVNLDGLKNTVYFDLETQKAADEVGGWNHIAKMQMSIGVTFSTARGDYKIYGEKDVNDLLTDLQRADLVVGFNILRFDYEVLHGYTPFDLRQLPTLDMMVDLQNKLQHRLSLDSIATATFGVEKTAEGMQAIRWFKEGKLAEIAEYCCYDVKLTKLVHEYGQRHHQVHYHNRFGKKMTVPVSW